MFFGNSENVRNNTVHIDIEMRNLLINEKLLKELTIKKEILCFRNKSHSQKYQYIKKAENSPHQKGKLFFPGAGL